MATFNSDGTSASVQAYHDGAGDGDIVTIPAGTFHWTTGVVFTKNIILQGSGVGVTIIEDALNSGQLILWTLAPNGLGRITGIEFHNGGRVNVGAAPGGLIKINGSNTNGSAFRFDNNKWVDLFGYLVCETVIGVIDHNTVITGALTNEWLYPYGSNWDGVPLSDGSWAAPADYGSSQFLFIEDNVLTNVNAVFEGQMCDGFNGARYVVRYNSITNYATGNHGTETGGRGRSGRAQEIYNNTFDLANVNRFVANARGGGILFHDNTVTGTPGGSVNTNPVSIGAFRMFGAFSPWGGADGTNQWDQNNVGNPFFSGILTGASGQTVTIASAGWATNQWTGYTLKRTAGGFSYIDSNTINTITFRTDIFGGQPAYAIGDAIVINKVNQALDQAGAGASTLITGDPPVFPVGFTQGIEPCYSWGNTNGGGDFNSFDRVVSCVQPGVHYFENTAMPGYTPYTYPHPLQSGTLPDPVEPGDALVIAGSPIY